ncbi:hypothetical protein [Saccharopolyspora pogona]|uniref:hypothetical protein n=1 Tax=Saccharopolyspora pogona TaxID=333966 RepID=UPI00168771AD|nr:hypothetical protein [Saccharopolyspora pogona]
MRSARTRPRSSDAALMGECGVGSGAFGPGSARARTCRRGLTADSLITAVDEAHAMCDAAISEAE